LEWLIRNETQSREDSCMSCLMHRTRSCVHISHKELVQKTTVTVAVKRARWKKSSKDWRDLNENWWKVVGRNTDREAEDYVHVDSCRRHYTHCSCSGWRKRRSGLGGNQHRYDPLLAVGDGHPQMQRHLCG